MFRMVKLYESATVFGLLLAVSLLASPSFAQSTGLVRGRVLDGEEPVVGAKVTIESLEGPKQVIETETDEDGRFRQMGLRPNQYQLIVVMEGAGSQQSMFRIAAGQNLEVNFNLAAARAAATAALSEEDLAKVERIEDLQASFEAGVAASNAGNYQEAIASFQAAVEVADTCYDCYHNLGIAHVELEDYESAEQAFKRALALKPDLAASYTGLANIYNAQRRFDEAAEASAEAAKLSAADGGIGVTDPIAVFNQAVIFWNARKIAEAKAQFEETITLDPDHADAHYFLAMANLNEGNLPEAASALERYLELDPSGQYADQARGMLPQIKQ